MGRHSKAAKKKVHGIAQACTYRSTTGTPAGPTNLNNAGEVNGQEGPTPPIVSNREQELNEAEYLASEPGDQWG